LEEVESKITNTINFNDTVKEYRDIKIRALFLWELTLGEMNKEKGKLLGKLLVPAQHMVVFD
jgi:hypothetical protein